MLNHNRGDNHGAQDHIVRSPIPVQMPNYYVIVSQQVLDDRNSLLDRVIDFALDTLGVRRLQLRVYDDA